MASIIDNMERRLSAFKDAWQKRSLELILGPVLDGTVTRALNNPGLAITGVGSTTVSSVNAVYAVIEGSMVSLASGVLPALTGFNVGAGKYGVCMFLLDGSGAVSLAYSDGTATSMGTVKFPLTPNGKACIGFILVTYASAFTGGTTPLDTATTVYVNTNGDFNAGLVNSL